MRSVDKENCHSVYEIDLSTVTVASIDEEISVLLTQTQETATKILTDHLEVLHHISQFLQDKEVISGEELADIVKSMQ